MVFDIILHGSGEPVKLERAKFFEQDEYGRG